MEIIQLERVRAGQHELLHLLTPVVLNSNFSSFLLFWTPGARVFQYIKLLTHWAGIWPVHCRLELTIPSCTLPCETGNSSVWWNQPESLLLFLCWNPPQQAPDKSLVKPRGEWLARGTAGSPVLQPEPPPSARQERELSVLRPSCTQGWVSWGHTTAQKGTGQANTHPSQVPCPWEKQQRVQRHQPDPAFPRVSHSSALQHEHKGKWLFTALDLVTWTAS